MSNQVTRLQSLRNQYKSYKELLIMDLTNWDPRTRPGLEGKQNEAKVKIEEVKNSLAREILKNSSITIVLRDYPQTHKVVEAAKANPEKNALIDYLSVEKSMYKAIFGERDVKVTFNTETLNRMNVFMSEVGERLGALSIPTLTATSNQYGTLPGRQEMIEKMEAVSQDTYGYEMKQLSIRSLVFDRVIDRLGQDSINIVLVNAAEGFAGLAQAFAGNSVVLGSESGDFTLETEKPKPKRTRTAAVKTVVDDQQS